jgi:hypothetical protein
MKLCDLGLQLRSEGGVHINARLLPLSERYILMYATPIANACATPSQRVILQATRYELRQNRWKEVPFS